MTSPLDRLAVPDGSPVREPKDDAEFAGLVDGGLSQLTDAGNVANSLRTRFILAYGAAHALCPAALRHHGFGRRIGSSFFRSCRTRSGSVRRCCAYSANVPASEIAASTKANSMSMTGSCQT